MDQIFCSKQTSRNIILFVCLVVVVVVIFLCSLLMRFPVVRNDRSRSSFRLNFHRGRLSKRGPRGFEHNAAQLARSQWIQAKKEKNNNKRNRGSNLRQQLSCAPEIDAHGLRHGVGTSPTRCACVSVAFQNHRFLTLKTTTNISIMCTSRDSGGKLSKYSIFS